MNQNALPLIGKYRFGWSIVVLLVFLFVFGLVTGLTESIWRLSPGWLIPYALLSTVIGWFFGGAKRKPALYFISGIMLGLILLITVQSGFYRNFYQAYLDTFRIQVHFKPPQLYLPNTGPLFYYLYTALNNLANYLSEISQWVQGIVFNRGGFNQLAINLVWGSMVWAVSFTMGWLLRRKSHPFTASLPALILLSAVIGFTRQRSSGLIITLTALLGLIVLFEHLKRENRWENKQMDYSEELRFEIISITVPIVALIMIIATLVPRISFENIRTLLFNQQRIAQTDHGVDISESFGLEQTPFAPPTTTIRPSMPRSHLIGSNVELAETLIMEIDTGETFLPPQVETRAQLPKYYWFGRSYDIYTSSGWMTDEIRTATIPANQEITDEKPLYFQPVVHQIRKTNTAPTTLYFAGVLNAVDQNITVAWHETTGEYFSAQLTAREYQVYTYIYDFTEEQLRQYHDSPPDIILETYLQLPTKLPERVNELAKTITEQATTPYEQAKLIESYLRQYEYSLELPTPPQDRDLVDYFLFELQEGYCDYFASAMVVLSRASDLPARLAVGYATGTYDYAKQAFVVTEANAHAWPEIYIEPVGWVPFEPTASFSAYNWSAEAEIFPSDLPIVPREEGVTRPEPVWLEFLGVAILFLLIFSAGFLWFLIYSHRKKQTSTNVQIESIYHKMQVHLSQHIFTLQTEHTPREVFLVYTEYLNEICSRGFTQKLSNQILEHIEFITNLHEKGIYSPHTLPTEQIKEARQHLFNVQLEALLLKAALLIK